MVALQSLKTLFTFFIEVVNTRCEKSETLYIYLIGLDKIQCFKGYCVPIQGDQIVRFLADCAVFERSVRDDLVCESPPLGVRFSVLKVAVLAVFSNLAKN